MHDHLNVKIGKKCGHFWWKGPVYKLFSFTVVILEQTFLVSVDVLIG